MIYNLPQILENSSILFPEREAFRCGKNVILYKELNQKTNQLAQFLINLGIKKGDRVGIYLNRCLDNALAIYGIMKSGGIYVPLNPSAPSQRNLFVINDCNIQFLISNPKQKRNLLKLTSHESPLKGILGISDDWQIPTFSWESIFTQNDSYTPPRILEQDPAYILYTSGSTGTPKGILHTHYSGLAYAKLTSELYQLNEFDRIANHAPLHFDISTLGFFTAPLVGATTVIIPEAYTRLAASVAALMEKEKITVWYSVPLALIQILHNGAIEKKSIKSLRWVLYAGESFPIKHLKKLLHLLPQATFSNIYGPTETNQCTFYNFNSLDENEESVPLGQVWNNSDFLIIDEQNNIVAPENTGELLIRSATCMKCYWNQPQLTEASFFIKKNQIGIDEKFYRTGDLVRFRSDGNLIFLGRKDRQIKIRGYRIELDEIESLLLSHEEVKEAATFLIEINNVKIIAAAIILKTDNYNSTIDFHKFLGKFLPEYSIPKKIKTLSDFPRTPTGKIDRNLLKTNYQKLITNE